MSNNSSQRPLPDPWGPDLFGDEMGIALTILGLLICVLDLIGNVTVIHIVRTRVHMRSTTNLLIANLAAADLLMVLILVYLTKHFFVGFRWFGGVLGQVTCKFAHSIQPLSVLCSVLTLSAITFDRFFAIMFPLLVRFITLSKTRRVIVFIWASSIAFSIPVTIVSRSVQYGNGYVCFENWKAYGLSYRQYVIAFFAIGYAIPLVVMSTLYLIMGVKLWKSSAPGYQTAEAMQRIKRGRRKSIKMLTTVVSVFTLCWIPLQVAEILNQFAPEVYWSIPFKLNWILPYFGIANSVANPFIYFTFCETFRVEFAKVLWCAKGVGTSKDATRSSTKSTQPIVVKSVCSTEMVPRQQSITNNFLV